MWTAARFDLMTLVRLIGYLALGGLGSVALLIPLAGVLSYLAIPSYPVLLGWFLYGGVLAVTRHPRMARIYLFANLGIIVATLIASAASYLAVVLLGLGTGSAFGAHRRKPLAQSH
jgi:hypothetical protein